MHSGPNWAANGYKITTIVVASQAFANSGKYTNDFTFKVGTLLNSAPIPTLTYSHLMAGCLCTLPATRIFELMKRQKSKGILGAGKKDICGGGGRIRRDELYFPKELADEKRYGLRHRDESAASCRFNRHLPKRSSTRSYPQPNKVAQSSGLTLCLWYWNYWQK
jgi:hypothetical protein